MENKQKSAIVDRLTPSAKILVAVEIISASLALMFLIGTVVVYVIGQDLGLKTFSALFFPIIICLAVALTTGINQTCRGKNALTVTFLAVASACTLLTVGVIIFECVTFGKLFLAPFTFVG